MKNLVRSLLCCAALLVGQFALAEDIERGTKKDAEELVKKAVAYIKANGKEKGFAEISTPSSQFHRKDLFVAVYDLNGINLAHGVNPKVVGKNLLDVTDNEGKPWMRERIALAKAKGKGWQDYTFPNPVTKKVELKSSYFELLDDFIVNCGYSKPLP